jgi:2-polyprenyl-3-methyl-5-hydroxy-6-metoxy-1,4-benzoquinol methylase
MKIDLVGFPTREDRTNYIWQKFQPYLQEQVLDIGCFEAPLRKIIGKERYTGVDVAGNPDIVLNLEQCEQLPFEDSSYPIVMCMDVLEHLDNFHAMFDELVRVSSRYILISLPNCWNAARTPIKRGGALHIMVFHLKSR